MALFFGLFSMPALQAAPANGWAVGAAVKAISPLDKIYYRRRRYRRYRCPLPHGGLQSDR
jgi:hypothetical protein